MSVNGTLTTSDIETLDIHVNILTTQAFKNPV